MDQQQQSRWRPTRRQLLWAGGLATLAFLIIVICGYLFGWKWTGLPKRTLWDWLDLLIVPVVLALGGYLFTRSENQRTQEAGERQRAVDRELADQQRSLDREIADQRRQDDMLQAYLDGMSQLLTDKERPLHRAELGDYLSTVARARTLTVLTRLDGERKGSVVRFLYESGLITMVGPILALHDSDLSEANLSGANLSRAGLRGANLSRANLIVADLSGAFLNGTNLCRADLSRANLSETDLSKADLSKADLIGANLIRADLRGIDLRGTALNGANLSGANLIEADVRDAYLIGADMRDAKLLRANLSGTNLFRANLRETKLREADLSGTLLSEADLRRAYLLRANLLGADLSGANLTKANLTKANLREVTGITHEDLEQQAESLRGATMPNGQKYEEWLKSKGRGEDG